MVEMDPRCSSAFRHLDQMAYATITEDLVTGYRSYMDVAAMLWASEHYKCYIWQEQLHQVQLRAYHEVFHFDNRYASALSLI